MSSARTRTQAGGTSRAGKWRRPGWLIVGLAVAMVATVATVAIVFLLQPGSGASAKAISQVGTQDYHALALAPGNPDTVFFGHHGGILRSTDGGESWERVPGLSQDAMNLAVSRQNPEDMYLAGHEVFKKSEDGGGTWRDVQNNLPGLDLHWFVMDPDNSSRLYANAVGFGLHRSEDDGATWEPWALQVPTGKSLTALAVLGGDPVNVLAGTEEGNVLLSVDGGVSWDRVGSVDARPMTFSLNPDAGTIYLGTMNGIHRSKDNGLTWTRLPLNTTVVILTAGGSSPEWILVVNNKGEVFRSDDGGRTW